MQGRYCLYTASDNALCELESSHARLGEAIVGHVPCEKLCVVWYFTKHDGAVTCQVTD